MFRKTEEMSIRRRVLAACLLVLMPGVSHAIADCSVSATAVGFGAYNTLSGTPDDSTGTVTVSCSLIGLISLLVSYNIALSQGGAGSYSPRRMTGPVSNLNYNLYTNSTRTTVWGDGTSGTSTISDGYLLGIGTTVRNYTVYGRIPALQNVGAGAYADTITVTVTY